MFLQDGAASAEDAAATAAMARNQRFTVPILLQSALRLHKKIANACVWATRCVQNAYALLQIATHLYVFSVIFDNQALDCTLVGPIIWLPKLGGWPMTDRREKSYRRTRAVCLAVLFAMVALAPDARAGTAQSPFTVTGNVVANCSISTTGMSFTYDPVVANSSANALAVGGTVTIACTKGSAPSIGLDNGRHVRALGARQQGGANLQHGRRRDRGSGRRRRQHVHGYRRCHGELLEPRIGGR